MKRFYRGQWVETQHGRGRVILVKRTSLLVEIEYQYLLEFNPFEVRPVDGASGNLFPKKTKPKVLDT